MLNGASEFVNQLAIAVTTIVFNRTALSFAGEDGVAAVSIIMYLQFLFIGVYFGFSMGMAPPLSYAYGNRKIRICRKLESYARRFFAVAPIIIYALTYFLTPVAVSCFADTSSPVFPIAVSGMRIYGLGFLFSGINIFAFIPAITFIFDCTSFEIWFDWSMARCSCSRSSDIARCCMVSAADSLLK